MDDVTRITLRLPSELADALKDIAQQENRSLHGQIVHALRQFVESQLEPGPKPGRPRRTTEGDHGW